MFFYAQIEATQENRDPPSEQQPARRSDGVNNELANHLSTLAFKLALTEEEHNVSVKERNFERVDCIKCKWC